MIVLDRVQIEGLIDLAVAGPAVEAAYIAASRGEVNLPPVGHITFSDLAADCHIKYGHRKGDPFFVIKVATGFPQNDPSVFPSGNGLSLVMSAQSGAVQAVLHDEMVMTDIRTGLGGAIATRCLARGDSKRALVVGTGPQALRQIESHAALFGDGLSFEVWGRSPAKATAVVDRLRRQCKIAAAENLGDAVQRADIIVTATGTFDPLIKDDWVRDGTHITAVGADAPGKQELEASLIARADVLVADSVDQSLDHGELSHAFKSDLISRSEVEEIGSILSTSAQGRSSSAQITIADLTGIAAQTSQLPALSWRNIASVRACLSRDKTCSTTGRGKVLKMVGDPGIEPGVRLREGVTVPCHTLRPVAHCGGDYLRVWGASTSKSGWAVGLELWQEFKDRVQG